LLNWKCTVRVRYNIVRFSRNQHSILPCHSFRKVYRIAEILWIARISYIICRMWRKSSSIPTLSLNIKYCFQSNKKNYSHFTIKREKSFRIYKFRNFHGNMPRHYFGIIVIYLKKRYKCWLKQYRNWFHLKI